MNHLGLFIVLLGMFRASMLNDENGIFAVFKEHASLYELIFEPTLEMILV